MAAKVRVGVLPAVSVKTLPFKFRLLVLMAMSVVMRMMILL